MVRVPAAHVASRSSARACQDFKVLLHDLAPLLRVRERKGRATIERHLTPPSQSHISTQHMDALTSTAWMGSSSSLPTLFKGLLLRIQSHSQPNMKSAIVLIHKSWASHQPMRNFWNREESAKPRNHAISHINWLWIKDLESDSAQT
ncbi:unnamed protein product [Musa acuminata subsp. malaccensis]|uniref:(wild Malaysian banana) hypothetical protein n=1 Tax=Musa acuminata subsp. malaccensis TaxID=214687 RepID=A0A804JQU2_MUSAM|nr:PREDICTED: uncharacterized protein LOC103990960 [Musa acuminata subsp. malaccensis]CAG1855267.1 unnamed protein product [Musa acuminata subsp. malaccensis]